VHYKIGDGIMNILMLTDWVQKLCSTIRA